MFQQGAVLGPRLELPLELAAFPQLLGEVGESGTKHRCLRACCFLGMD